MLRLKYLTIICSAALSLSLTGCSGSSTNKNSGNKNTAAPAANSNTSTAKPKTVATPTTEIKNEKKPEGTAKAVPASKKVPAPANWIFMYDENKGYSFYVPEGTKGGSDTVNGIDVYIAQTPAPSDVVIMVLAYKDKTKTKEDLLNDAERVLQALGDTVQAGTLTAESDDYALADAVSTDANGKKTKMKILVGTDVTDNYVMIVGTDESKFAANSEIIDAIWGNFEMWSGGASQN